MDIKRIESLQHPLVKATVQLRESSKVRKERQEVLIAGKKLVQEAPVRTVLFVEQGAEIPEITASTCYLVTPAILKKITGLVSPEPIAGIVPLPTQDTLRGKQWLLVLDEIQDPGNLGTLVRTALALGWEGAFITEGSADLFNEKAIRAAKGASFRLPYRIGTKDALVQLLEEGHVHVYIADLDGAPLSKTLPKPPMALILSNEARGASAALKERFPALSIPSKGSNRSMLLQPELFSCILSKHDRQSLGSRRVVS